MDQELPDTNDPYELLGVEPQADARTLKRAYVRLIKRFRPERSPDAFQRIQAAYDAIRDGQAWRAPLPRQAAPPSEEPPTEPSSLPQADSNSRDHPPEAAAAIEPASEPPPEPGSEPLPLRTAPPMARQPPLSEQVESALAHRDYEGARTLLHSAKPEHRNAPWWYALAAQAEAGAEGRSTAGVPHWAAALRSGVPISAALWQAADEACLEALYAEGLLDWHILRKQPDSWETAALLEAHVDRALLAGRAGELLKLAGSADFQRQQLKHTMITPVLWRLAAYGCFDDPAEAERLMALYPGGPNDWNSDLDAYDQNQPAAAWLVKAVQRHGLPPELVRLLRYGRLGDGYAPSLLQDAAMVIGRAPESLLAGLDLLAKRAPALLARTRHLCDRLCPTEARSWDKLSPNERHLIDALARKVDQKLDAHLLNGLGTINALMTLVGVVGGFVVWGWWGLAALLAGSIYLVVSTLLVDRWLYRHEVRPYLAQELSRSGLSPDRIGAWFTEHSKLTDDISRFDGEIAADTPLDLIAAIARTDRSGQPDATPDTDDPAEEPQPGGDTGRPEANAAGAGARTPRDTAHCAAHPDRPANTHCNGCGAGTCADCEQPDDEVGHFCERCQGSYRDALRRSRLSAESSVRAVATVPSALAGAALLGAMGASDVPTTIAALVAALVCIATARGMLQLQRWAKLVYVPLALAMLAAVPIGTAVSLFTLFKLFNRSGRRILTAEHRTLVAATPGYDTTPRRRLQLIAIVTATIAITSLLKP